MGGVTFVATSGCTEDPSGAPTCSLGPIPSGNSTDYTITVDVDNSTLGVISNQASVTATELDPDTTNDITTQNTLVSDGSEPTIVDIQVTSSTDDAEETAGGNVSTKSSDLELVFDRGGNQTVGLRFPGVAVPAGATILSAYVQFQVDETSTIATSLSIVGEASVNAATFAKTAGNISSRATVGTPVAWEPSAWNTKGEAGPLQRTPELAALIQQIISQPGWNSGNALALIITGTGERVAESFDGDSSGAPSLLIQFVTN